MKKGYFYLMKLDGERIKFGFSTDIAQRLRDTQTYVPDASLIKLWYCPHKWCERKAIEYTSKGLPHIGGEVYICSNLPEILTQVEAFFQIQVPLLEKARRDAREQKIRDYWNKLEPQYGNDEVRKQMARDIIAKRLLDSSTQ